MFDIKAPVLREITLVSLFYKRHFPGLKVGLVKRALNSQADRYSFMGSQSGAKVLDNARLLLLLKVE